jgi:hypothetical protein
MDKLEAKKLVKQCRVAIQKGEENAPDLLLNLVNLKIPALLGYTHRDNFAEKEFNLSGRSLQWRIRAGRQRESLRRAGISIPEPSGLTLTDWAQARVADTTVMTTSLAEGHNFVDSYWLAVGDQTPLGIDIDLTNTNQVVPVLALLKSLEIIGGSFSHTEISEVEEELIIALAALTEIVSSIEGEQA